MQLSIKFGLDSGPKLITWDKNINDFPRLIKFQGKKWEWFMYNDIGNGVIELNYSQIATYDPNFYIDTMENFEDLFKTNEIKCECGSAYGPFEWDHFRYCKMWKPWDKL